MEAPPEPRSRRRARALPPQHGPAMASHVASTWPRPCCTAQPPPAALYARTTVRLRLWVPSMGTDKMPVRPGRPCAAMAMATRLMAETGMMMPASGSDGSCWSKVAEMQQLRMPPHERQWSTTLLPLSRSRTPPSRSQHLHSCTLEDRVAARISLLGRGCGALGAERGNKTSERVVSSFCPLLDPPRFRSGLSWTHPHPLCKRKDQSRIKSARSSHHMNHDKQLRDTQLTAATTTYNNNNCEASTHTHLSHSHD